MCVHRKRYVKGLDLRHPGDDAANGNELSEMHAFDFAYGHRDVRVSWLEVETYWQTMS
jgi:hypothetical protein